MSNRIDGNLTVSGHLTAGSFTPTTGSVGDTEASSARPFGVDKQVHQHVAGIGDPRATAVATTTGRFLYRAGAAGTLVDFTAGVVVAGVAWVGGGKADVHLLKNGVYVLSAVVTIDGTTLALSDGEISAGIDDDEYVAGDVFEVEITVTAGTGTLAKGFYCSMTVNEAAF